MSDIGFSHRTVQDRKQRIGLYSWIVWVVGLAALIASIFTIGLIGVVLAVITIATGTPIPNVGPPHAWVQRELERRQQWRRDRGMMMAPPLNSSDDDEPCKIVRVQVVNARVEEKDEDTGDTVDNFLPVLTTEERDHATIALRLPGAGENWLKEDHYGKYMIELGFFELISAALGVTTVDDLHVAFTRVHRPPNREVAFGHAHRRGNPEILDPVDDDSVEGRLARNLAERIDRVYDQAGSSEEYCFVRTRWPTRLGRKIGVGDVGAFRRSPLFRTAGEVAQAYIASGIEDTSFLAPDGTQEMWNRFWRVNGIDMLNMTTAQAQAMRRGSAVKAQEGVQPPLDNGVSIRRPKPGTSGYIDYNGSIHIAGYVKSFVKSEVRPGFRHDLDLSDNVYWAMTTYVEAKRREGESTKARERERIAMMTEGHNFLEKGLSDPEGGARLRESQERRSRIAEAGNRVARYYTLVSLVADSVEEAENRWEDLVTSLSRVGYKTDRAHDPDDIEDILLAQFGVRMER